jgi:cation:H+ antiporter
MLSVGLIIVGFFVLIYGANFLVDGASALASRLNVSKMVIGLTIVAFGTSSPELVVNVFASVNGNPQIVLGNVVGSNIFNIGGILGLCALIYPLAVKRNTTWIEIPIAFASSAILLLFANDIFLNNVQSNDIDRSEGVLLLLFFLVFLAYIFQLAKKGDEFAEVVINKYSLWKSILLVVAGLTMLVVGGKLIVDNAVKIATLLGWSERVIGLTIVSIGTSLPELATSLVAVRKRNVDIAVGNIVGSNIFNVFLILGVSAVVEKIPLTPENQYDLFVNIVISLLLFVFMFTGKRHKLDRFEGGLFLAIFVAYLISLLV